MVYGLKEFGEFAERRLICKVVQVQLTHSRTFFQPDWIVGKKMGAHKPPFQVLPPGVEKQPLDICLCPGQRPERNQPFLIPEAGRECSTANLFLTASTCRATSVAFHACSVANQRIVAAFPASLALISLYSRLCSCVHTRGNGCVGHDARFQFRR